MEFRCFNGMNNCDYCGSCHSEFKVRTSDEKRQIYNQALEDFEVKIKECCSIVGSCDYEDMERIKEQLKR